MTDYQLTIPNGSPLPPDADAEIRAAGAQLAYDAAAHSDDPEYVRRLFEATIAGVPAAFGFIFTAAFDILLNEVVVPAMGIAAESGRDLRPMLLEIAATKPDRGA